MSLVICDTNVFIHYFKSNQETVKILEEIIGLDYVLVPSLVLMELCKGAWNKKELDILLKHLRNYKILHFDQKVSEKATELVQTYHLSHNLSMPDSIIAAMCLVHDLPLFTYNIADFHYIKGIKLFNP